MTRFAGKYYTQDECKEVAAYAKERGVIIIPEIDMPGHSEAFVRAMGYDMQTDEGVEVLKNVLTQVASVFPDAPYIHIGADEKAITYTDADGKVPCHNGRPHPQPGQKGGCMEPHQRSEHKQHRHRYDADVEQQR